MQEGVHLRAPLLQIDRASFAAVGVCRNFDDAFGGVRGTLLESFADHDSPSVQASIWIMGRAILERHETVDEVRMVLPNLHHWAYDLTPFGLENRAEIFVATTEPHGLIEATVRRSDR